MEDNLNILVNARRQLNLKQINKFPLAPMGALAPGSAHARPSAQAPINTSGNFSLHMSGREGGKTNLKKFPIKFLVISGDSKHFSFFSPQKIKST